MISELKIERAVNGIAVNKEDLKSFIITNQLVLEIVQKAVYGSFIDGKNSA